jgi:hypothetical protein
MCRLLKLVLFASAVGLGGMVAWAVFRPTVDGSGNAATEDRQVGDVTAVVLSGVGDLTVVQGEVPGLSVTADDNILPLIETETSGRKLTISTKSHYNLRPKTKITYTLTVPKLEKVTVSGAGNVKAEKLTADNLTFTLSGAGNMTLREVTCKTLTVTLSGAGNATVSGTAEKVTATISGAGDIDAAALKAASVEVKVSGAGDATVWATDELKARVSGAGSIKYKGTPKVEQKVSGAGSIKPMGG